MKAVQKYWKGVLLCLAIAVPSHILGKTFPVIGGPVIAILAGMVISLAWKEKGNFQDGIKFTSKKVLQWAVILLGFGLNLSVVLETGKQSLPIILSTISTSLIVSYLLCKIMHVPAKISTLIGVGSSICGGSAVAATAPVIDADDEEVAQAESERPFDAGRYPRHRQDEKARAADAFQIHQAHCRGKHRRALRGGRHRPGAGEGDLGTLSSAGSVCIR